jgi:hypothetical protein
VLACRAAIRWVFTAAIVATVGAAVAARGAEPEDARALLRRGIALQREANWNASIAALERARATGVLAPAERVECAFYLGAAYLAVGSDGAARRELDQVLEVQPNFEPPPYTSPKLAALLGEVFRQRAQAPALDARPPRPLAADAEQGSGVELTFEARRATAPIYGVVRYRLRGEARWREAPLSSRGADGVAAAVRPPASGVLEYYADALSAAGPLRVGTAAAPLELPLSRVDARKTPRTRGPSKLVWLAVPIGAVVGVALGVGLYFGLRSR